ncbi:MAG: DEAD/DEAH box helicase family protein, partial [Candidatus Heimdallarchaeaceae archaeon]
MIIPADFEDEVSELTIEKRDYQLSAVKEIIQAYPEKSVLLNYPYGTGKTIIALLSFLVIKKSNPDAKFLFTSAREAANLRCRQALEMAKDFGFIEKIGYLYDSTGKGVSLRQKSKMYEAATAIFSPITALMNDYLEIKTKLRIDILDNINLCVIDEATDILAREISGFRLSRYFESLFRYREKNGNFPILALREISGFRLSRYFESLFRYREKNGNFPILALTGTRDKQRAKAIFRILGNNTLLMQRLDLSPYETITKIQKVRREDYIKIDQLLSTQISKPVETIQNLMDKNLSRLEIIKLSYGGIL